MLSSKSKDPTVIASSFSADAWVALCRDDAHPPKTMMARSTTPTTCRLFNGVTPLGSPFVGLLFHIATGASSGAPAGDRRRSSRWFGRVTHVGPAGATGETTDGWS